MATAGNLAAGNRAQGAWRVSSASFLLLDIVLKEEPYIVLETFVTDEFEG